MTSNLGSEYAFEPDMQKKTDDYIKKVDELCAKKEKELSEI